MFQLRPDQELAVSCCEQHLRARKDNPCIVIPTGGGKSVVIAEMVRRWLTKWPQTRILILVHVQELVRQNAEKLVFHWPDAPLGIHSAGLGKRDVDQAVIFGSIQSVWRQQEHMGKFDIIMVDEAHRIPANGEGLYRKLIKAKLELNPYMRVIGFTATPYRLSSGPVCHQNNILNVICYESKILPLIKQGWLSPLTTKATATKLDSTGVKVRHGEYVQGDLDKKMSDEGVVKETVNEIIKFAGGRKAWIVFCSGSEHARLVLKHVGQRGVSCALIDYKTPKELRKRHLQRFMDGTLKCIVNINVLSEGFDAPHVSLIALLRPTLSPGLYYQQVGRGMRVACGKENCLVLDFAGNILRHGPVDDITPPRRSDEAKPKPMKTCPECMEIVPAAKRICPDCGYEFPYEPQGERIKHETRHKPSPILSNQIKKKDPIEVKIKKVEYRVHYKIGGGPRSLRVTYSNGFNFFHEWVPLEHRGWARQKAEQWWFHRAKSPAPRSAEEAINEVNQLRQPVAIVVDMNDKHPRVVGYKW